MKSKSLWTTLIILIMLVGSLSATISAQEPTNPSPTPLTDTSRHASQTKQGGQIDATRILDDFNRADGPLGPDWTVHDGTCSISSNAAVCSGNAGRATFNGAPGNGDVAEADVAAVGTDLQYTGLLLNYGAGVDNLFLKVQGSGGQFTDGACYTGNNGTPFGLDFFALDAPFSTAHMRATRVGDDVTIEFSNVDGGAQPDQTYVCTGAPPREGTGIGILGYNGIARLDNFGVPTQSPPNSDGLLYLTSLDTWDATFAVYNPVTDVWTTLAAYNTGCQMATNNAGRLYAHNYNADTIDRYNPASDTWTPVSPGPPGATGEYCNLEITNAGEFLYTEWQTTTLWYTENGSWYTQTLPFVGNAMGDYDPTTDQYVVGEAFTTNAHMIDVNDWTITDFGSALPNGEWARSGVVLGNRYYFEADGNNMHSFDLGSPADPPFDHGVSPGWYTSAAADRFYALIYNASLDGTQLNLFDPATNSISPLTGYSAGLSSHSSLAFVPGPPMTVRKGAPDQAEPGAVISYTLIITTPMLMDGMYMSDTLPAGVEYAGNLAWSDGDAWYDAGDNAVYWAYTAPPRASAPAAPHPTVYDPEAVADLADSPVAPAGSAPTGPLTLWARPDAVLWDNGPLVTHPGDCSGMDASRLQTGLSMNTLGFGHQFLNGNRVADEFEIIHPLGWQIDTVTFFAYQTNALSATSPITGVYYQIWDGPPDDPGSSVVWGDLSTNRLLTSTLPNLQRDSGTSPCANNRYVFANEAEAGVTLPPGTYWLDWSTDGSLASGPWAPPTTILSQTTTGNALQYTTSWGPALDSGTGTQQGLPFIIDGTLLEPAHVEITFDVTVTASCNDVIINEGVAGRGPLVQPFAASTAVQGQSDITAAPPALETGLCPDTTEVVTLTLCNTGNCELEWHSYEQTRTRVLPPVAAVGLELPMYEGVSSSGPVPADPMPSQVPPSAPMAPLGTLAYAIEYVNQYWTGFNLDAPGVLPNLGPFPSADFTGAGEYVDGYVYVADTANNLFQVDPATGMKVYTMTLTPPPGTETYTGMAFDPTSGEVYLSSCNIVTSHLFTVDVTTGVAITVGQITDSPCTIGIAVDGNGQMWGYDIVNDVFMAIDKATGAGTVIGPLGFDANFGQGLGWDPVTDQVYMAAFNNSTFQSELRIVNTSDGSSTLVEVLGSAIPRGLTQLPFLALPIAMPAPVDIPWLSQAPLTGTLPAGECMQVEVTFDATGYGPGDYWANLLVLSNDPDEPILTLPVTMSVSQPAEILSVTTVITDLSVAFAAEVTGTPPISHSWAFGDGGTSTEIDPSHTYAEGGCYTATLEVANCNTDTWSDEICVEAPCVVITDVGLSLLTVGDIYTDTLVQFQADIAPDEATKPYTYTVDYGDGNTSDGTSSADPFSFDHVYTDVGTHTVEFAAWNCDMITPVVGTVEVVVIASEVPTECVEITGVDLSLLTAGDIYTDTLVQFEADISPDDFSAPYTYTIDYGDGNTDDGTSSDDPYAFNHTYTTTGTYTVELAAWNCDMTVPITDTVEVVVMESVVGGYSIYLPIVIKSD